MNKIKHLIIVFLFCSTPVFSQSWTFNNNSLNNWSTVRISATTGTSHLTLTTTGQGNPKLKHSSPAIDADSNSYAIVKMRVGNGGPTLLRINFPNGNVKTPITTGTTGFVSYAINMTHNNWSGTINQIELAFKEDDGTTGGGTHSSSGVTIEIEEISFVDYVPSNQTVLYVDPINGSNTAVGSSSTPLQSIPLALDIAAANSISNVYLKSGTYNFSSSIDITTQSTSKVTLSPEPNGSVKLNLGGFRNFRFYQGAKNIEVKGFELDGRSNSVDHWTLLSQYVWQPDLLPDSLAGGGICFQIENAEDIFITNNVIHDFFQKAVNIEDGRYVKINGNVIYNIGHTSLSGGHGIMRQQGSGSFSTNDDPNKYRWDINGNLIFNVHQRIYSWVPRKGYLNMTLDEGKSILIDETPNHDTGMKARITNNVIAFGKIDAIRLKPTNGLEVSNNSVFSRDSHADGITNTTNGFNTSTYGTPFLNFVGKNNAVDVNAVTDAYKLDDAMASTGSSSSNNYAAYGAVVPTSVATYQNTDLFTDPDNGDFELLNTQLSNVGIPQSILDDLIARADTYNVTIANDHWQHDHLKNTQTLLDNIPGVEDGVAQNEPVFTDAGTYDASDLEFNKGRKAYYFTLNTTWKSDNISANSVLNRGNGLSAYDGKYELVVPEAYSDWLDSAKTDFLRDADGDGVGETAYSRIRYGASVIAQNKVFPAHTLQYISIDGDTIYTQTTANNHRLELNGLDLYVKVNYNPSSAQTYDLIVADSIQGVVNTVILDGYSGPYNTGVFNINGKQVLRLVLGATTFSGTNYYISGSGDDTNDGLSLTTPFETIDHAISQLSPGDTLNFITGTYTHSTYGDGDWFKTQNKTTVFINNVHGAANAYITFRPAPNQNVKIKGDGVAAIEVKASSYIRIEGFEVEGDVNIIPLDTARKYQFLYRDPQGLDQFRFAPGTSAAVVASTTNLPVLSSSYKRPTYFNVAGISVKNSNHIDVIDNYVHHMPGEGIKSFDSDYLLISGNKVHDCSRRSSHGVHGLSVYTLNSIDNNTGYKVIIENNEVFDNYNEVYSWNQTKTFVNPHYDEGKGITVQRCYPATGWTSGRILIRNNVAYRNGLSGIQVNSGERIDIYHNTVYGNHRTTEMYGDGAQHGVSIQSGDDINFKNNIAQSWSNAQGSKVYKVSANSTNITASDNLLIGGSDSSTNVLSSSPQFVDSTNYDFRLSSTSPAIDAGTSVGVTTDFLGKIRDSSPDYGAHEWTTGNCVANTGTDIISECDSYTWIDGVTYTSSNNSATHTLTNVNGCDSVVTLDLTINSSNTGTDVITACDSYTWIDGNTYTASNNTATYTLTNVNGCDSVVTLDLQIFTCPPPTPTYNVTFAVDMSNYTGSFNAAYVNGDFNGWCGSCNVLSDADGDGIWTATLPLTADSIEYKFTLDGWTTEESLTAGSSCTKTTSGFTNRFVHMTSDTTLATVCWESCSSCISGPPAGVTFDANGCLECDSLNVGDFFVLNGDSIEVVDRARLLNIIAAQGDLTKVCVSHVTNMKILFKGANWFNQDISHWDVSNVTNMVSMFFNADSFNVDISTWDVSSVTNMKLMFRGASKFNQGLNAWDVSNVTNMNRMFLLASDFNGRIEKWDVGNVTRMTQMFKDASSFDQDLSSWCVANFLYSAPSDFATNAPLQAVHYPRWGNCPQDFDNITALATGAFVNANGCVDCSALNIGDYFEIGGDTLLVVDRAMLDSLVLLHDDLSKVCVSNITDMKDALRGLRWFNTDIAYWDVSNVTDMSNMFFKARQFNHNIGNWDVSSVTKMAAMFQVAQAFNQDIGDWDVSNVERFRSMFRNADAFNQDIGGWDVSSVLNDNQMISMFRSADNFSQDLSSWCVSNISAKPSGFDANSSLVASQLPLWGTCPSVSAMIAQGDGPSEEKGEEQVDGDEVVQTIETIELVSLFPNPTTGVVQISPVVEGTFFIFNKMGRTISEGAIKEYFDFSNQPAGIYLLMLQTDNNTQYIRVVKQ